MMLRESHGNLSGSSTQGTRVVIDVAGQALSFANIDQLGRLFDRVIPDLQRELSSLEVLPGIATPEMSRPKLPPLPRLEDSEAVEELFIGRERLLADFFDALKGLDSRFRGQTPSGAATVQVAWYDGFGGMGKSWFLRKAKLETEKRLLPQAKVALIDWYLPALRAGLLMPPTEPKELFGVVAHRLGQLYGVEALDPYWNESARVACAAADHQNLIRRFQRGLARWAIASSETVPGAAESKKDDYLQEPKDFLIKDILMKEGL
jgi:hypothetical protein